MIPTKNGHGHHVYLNGYSLKCSMGGSTQFSKICGVSQSCVGKQPIFCGVVTFFFFAKHTGLCRVCKGVPNPFFFLPSQSGSAPKGKKAKRNLLASYVVRQLQPENATLRNKNKKSVSYHCGKHTGRCRVQVEG